MWTSPRREKINCSIFTTKIPAEYNFKFKLWGGVLSGKTSALKCYCFPIMKPREQQERKALFPTYFLLFVIFILLSQYWSPFLLKPCLRALLPCHRKPFVYNCSGAKLMFDAKGRALNKTVFTCWMSFWY